MEVSGRIESLIENLRGLKRNDSAEGGNIFASILRAALDNSGSVTQGAALGESNQRSKISLATDQVGDLIVQKNTDGSASVLFSGGGLHTALPSPGVDPVEVLQSVYNSRISNTVLSGVTSADLEVLQGDIRAADEISTISATVGGKPKYSGDIDAGFEPLHVSAYLNSAAGRIASPGTLADEYIADTVKVGARYLSRYFAPDQVAKMSQKQMLAANEIMTQGGGIKAKNYLSSEDLDFILNTANEFKGAVWSPLGQAISLGPGSGEAALYLGDFSSKDARSNS